MSSAPDLGSARRRLLFIAPSPSIDRLYEVDRLAVGSIHRPDSVVAVPGGKGLNAARAAATLGGTVTVITILAGHAGDWIAQELIELGIDARIVRASGGTRTCVSVLDRASGELTEFYERGAPIEPAAWDAVEAIVRAELELGDVAAVALSGSLLPGAAPDGYARIARMAAAAPVPIPVLVDAYGPTLAPVLAEHPAIVKLNAAEAGEATGVVVSDPGSAAAAANVLRDSGASCVVVTLGIAGAVVVHEGGRTQLISPDLRGSYPVGSGDAFLGGLAVAYARGESLLEAARLGMAAGIANAEVAGAGRLDPTMIGRGLDGISLRST